MYTANDVFALARRRHNTKRSYLLVNPLQAKHIPVRPSAAVAMMSCLGDRIAEKVPGAPLVIGFAETATAVAALAAERLGAGCGYIHTTREFLSDGGDRIGFLDIYDMIEGAMCAHRVTAHPSLEEILEAEKEARARVREMNHAS